MRFSLLFSLCCLFIASCHPFVMFNPKAIKTESTIGQDKIRITIDGMGLPYIKANNINDAMYGLGFMHARDRLFQLDLMRHAAHGKMSELFGERVHKIDLKLRLLTYRLDEQVSELSAAENLLLDNYCEGVNESAKQRGRTAEHFLLGVDFEEFTKRDVLAIARLQAWQLAADFYAEQSNLGVARSELSEAAKHEYLAAVDDRGTAIISDSLRFVEQYTWPHYLSKTISPTAFITPLSQGASNAWAVSGRLAKGGNAILMSDPHLPHSWPSNFYLATLETDKLFVTGATFVGLPGILIGATKNIAFGVTASYLNTQDSVVLTLADGDKNSYVIDGKKYPLKEWPQRFCSNKKGKCKDVMQYTSIYGPVIDMFDDKDAKLALQWTGFAVEQHKDPVGGFLALAEAPSVNEGITAIKSMTLPCVNMVLADKKGNIGYAFAGIIPRRDPKQHPFLPLDGTLTSSLWRNYLPPLERPQLINPEAGYIVTANQNIYDKEANPELNFGKLGAEPYRAVRIHERIKSLQKDNALIDFDALSDVQLDDTSAEAKELASLIGEICVQEFSKSDGYRQTFARSVQKFDGRYTKDSKEALPYEMLLEEILMQRIKQVHKDPQADYIPYLYKMRYAIKNALLKGLTGQKTAIFDDTKNQVRAACEPGYQNLIKRASKTEWAWRYGRHHFLQRESPIAKAPLIGTFFRDKKREVGGSQNSPMAEGGLPVKYGANLRFRVKFTDPPEIYAVIDAGNSGNVGHKNAFDQAVLWHEGKLLRMETDFINAKQKSKTYFELTRRPSNTTKN